MADKHRIVVVGGGFAGLTFCQRLRRLDADITLFDKKNHHLFQPLLYQVATGGLSPANIAAPLRDILTRQKNCRVLMAEVTGFDKAKKEVVCGAMRLPYDTLVIAAGATNSYFKNPEWEEHAIGLKTIEEATDIRARMLMAFENAEMQPDPAKRAELLQFVIVGGGPTGVEMAGAISELAKHTLRGDFRACDPNSAKVLVVEGSERLLAAFHPSSSVRALKALQNRGVEVWTGSRVKEIHADHIEVDRKDVGRVTVRTSNVIWGAGVKGSPIGERLAEAFGIPLERGNRLAVGPDLTLPNHPEIFVLGDIAAVAMGADKQVPGVAPAAMQQGKYAADVVWNRLKGKSAPKPFKYFDKGSLATIGRSDAVVEVKGIRFGGWFAWVAWLFIHILFLIQFQNRILVMLQWFFNFLTRNRSALLITKQDRKKGA